MKRGDLVSVAISGDYGKPRPALVVQSDAATETDSVLVCLLTSEDAPTTPFRVAIKSDDITNLRKPSTIMADKTLIALREKCGPVFGRAPQSVMLELDEALTFILGLGG